MTMRTPAGGIPRHFRDELQGTLFPLDAGGEEVPLRVPDDWALNDYRLGIEAGSPAWKTGDGGSAGGIWEPLTNGDPENPDLWYYDGDVMMYFVLNAG